MEKKPEFIAVANEKGGVGKTTTCLHLAACLKDMGFRVLMVDVDPSGNLSCATLTEVPERVLFDVIKKRCNIMDAIYETPIADILPTIKDVPGEDDESEERKTLTRIIGELDRSRASGAFRIAKLLRNSPIVEKYDFVICDSSPSDSILTTNLIVAADSIIIPCEPTSSSSNGLYMLMASIDEAKFLRHSMAAMLDDPSSYDVKLNVDGLVVAKFSDKRKTRREQYVNIMELVGEMNIPVYKTKIRDSAALESCMNENRPISDYANNGTGYADSMNFALEFLAKRSLAPRIMVPGIIVDETGKYIFCDKNTRYYTYEILDDKAKISVHSFTKSLLDNEAFMKEIGNSVFFSHDALSGYLEYLELTIVDELPEDITSDEAMPDGNAPDNA